MPVEILIMIFSYLSLMDLRSVRFAYGRYVDLVIRTHFRPSLDEYVRRLQAEFEDLHAQGEVVPTQALSIAAAYGNIPLIDALMRNRGISSHKQTVRSERQFLSGRDHCNKSALEWAAENGQDAAINFLLDKGARFTKGNCLWRSLELAIINGRLSTVKLLLKRECVLLSKGHKSGYRSYYINHYDFLLAFRNSVAAGHTTMSQLLFEYGMRLTPGPFFHLHIRSRNCRSVRRQILESTDKFCLETPLHLAAMNGRLEAVNLLLNLGADKEAMARNRYTALDYAIRGGHDAVIKLLLDRGALIEDQSRTSLLVAVRHERRATAQMLLERGAHPDHISAEGRILESALLNRDFTMISLLLNNGAKVQSLHDGARGILHEAAVWCDGGFILQLLDSGVEVDGIHNSKTALQVACEHGNCTAAFTLLSQGACPSIFEPKNKRMPLHVAALKGFPEIAKLLLDFGAQVDAKGAHVDNTALHLAAMVGDWEIARLLLDNEANVEEEDKAGRTALFFAVLFGHTSVIQLLLSRGASLAVRGTRIEPPSADDHLGIDDDWLVWDWNLEQQAKALLAATPEGASAEKLWRSVMGSNKSLSWSQDSQDSIIW